VARVLKVSTSGEPTGATVAMGGGAEGLYPFVSATQDHLAVVYRRGPAGGPADIALGVLDANLGVQSEVAVRSGQTGDATNPVTVWNGGGWTVAWEDQRLGDPQIFAAGVDAGGTQVSGGNSLFDDNGNWPAIASSGRYSLVAFYGFPAGAQVMLARVDGAGQLLGKVVQASEDGGTARYPALAYNPNADEFALVWQDDKVGEIFFARVKCP
jgi:hypothetical protein